ncbi:hypothetical protein M758_12G162200 [Ceratodon purpureus]|nr:hypothetical protein M758_12G162200 [Ceratodon purpureus]KAG0599568.1 hypothetical protein M758_12G162200 [Ceratodon purpureus]KAG0599571.1 hypothetical protein M758_12G162200 [Ceratodon purpureus]
MDENGKSCSVEEGVVSTPVENVAAAGVESAPSTSAVPANSIQTYVSHQQEVIGALNSYGKFTSHGEELGAEISADHEGAKLSAVVPSANVREKITSHAIGESVEDANVLQVTSTVTNEELWRKAIEEENREVLIELLAKDHSYFWKYEKKNGGTLLHIAAIQDDVMLVERILDRLCWAQEEWKTDKIFQRFNNMEFQTGRDYVEARHPSDRTAEELALEHEHAEIIREKICAYIANDTQRLLDNDKIMAADGSSSSDVFSGKKLVSEEQIKWNNAIKRKDCKALLDLLKNERGTSEADSAKFQSSLLKDDLQKAKSKCGKEDDRTVLHIASMQGCFQLVKSVLDQVCAQTSDASESLVHRYIGAVDHLSGLTAFEMANDIIGNKFISEYIKYIYESKGGKIKNILQNKTESDSYRTPLSFEAYPDTQWYTALERGDKDLLKKLVELNSRLLLETCRGLTVLHVAILWDDLGLVKTVVKLFGDSMSIKWDIDASYQSELKLKNMIEVHRKIDYGYLNKYWNTSSQSWVKLPSNMMKQLRRGGNSVLLLADKLERKQIQEELTKPNKISACILTKPDTIVQCVSQPYHPLPTGLSVFLEEKWVLSPLWSDFEVEFLNDVDFNFESDEGRQVWLRFHCACKHPHRFKDLLQQVSIYINQHPYHGFRLFQMCDAQGRTPFHILMDDCTDQRDPGWPFDEIFTENHYKEWIQTAQNARGKRVVDIVLTKNYLQRNISLEPWKYFGINFQDDNFERSLMTTFLYYQVAFLFKQRNVAEEIWSRFLVQVNMRKLLKKDIGALNSMLFFAASTGNQTYLQSLLETQPDPMITDVKGRSLLHHAADATLLQSHLVGSCCSTVKDICDVRKKWIEQTSASSTIVTANHGSSSASKCNIQDIAAEERSNAGRKACILMLLQDGVDLAQTDYDEQVPKIGPTIDAAYQIWWYEMGAKDSTEKKVGFNQAGNALSVVGTLVAAASYAGPVQPPLSYNDAGFVKITEPLVKWFMVSNSVAFYFAMASVMFAVVSSLPMPQEGMMTELGRAKHVVAFSLCLLMIAIGSIIISFATASVVVIQDEHSLLPRDLLFGPAIVGLFFCFIGISGFLIRLARLLFYRNPLVRKMYQFSVSWFCLKWLTRITVGISLGLIIFILFNFVIILFLVLPLVIFLWFLFKYLGLTFKLLPKK